MPCNDLKNSWIWKESVSEILDTQKSWRNVLSSFKASWPPWRLSHLSSRMVPWHQQIKADQERSRSSSQKSSQFDGSDGFEIPFGLGVSLTKWAILCRSKRISPTQSTVGITWNNWILHDLHASMRTKTQRVRPSERRYWRGEVKESKIWKM